MSEGSPVAHGSDRSPAIGVADRRSGPYGPVTFGYQMPRAKGTPITTG